MVDRTSINRISAQIIADSKNEFGQRLTTFILIFPRIVLSEYNTHRMLSKNSASSRAIPFEKMYKKVMTDPFIPIAFQRDHSGMQGTEYFEGDQLKDLRHEWHKCARDAAKNAKLLHDQGVTKQICNRLLEPFLYHTVICTGTEWENFFALRAHPAAEIHIADLAEKMLGAYNRSAPNILKAGEWHIPFGDRFDEKRLNELVQKFFNEHPSESYNTYKIDELRVQIATARCARVSYDNFDGTDDYEKDIQLYNRLLSSGHMSPFEHCAKAMDYNEMQTYICYANGWKEYSDIGWCGNFRGFIQLRKTISSENKSDNRVIEK